VVVASDAIHDIGVTGGEYFAGTVQCDRVALRNRFGGEPCFLICLRRMQ
jgi:hypothetical protein